MESHAEEVTVLAGKRCKLSSGKWYLRCQSCEQEARAEADLTESQVYGMLEEWRLSMDLLWVCPSCKESWGPITNLIQAGDELAQTTAITTNTAESASQDEYIDNDDVQQLKAEIVELKQNLYELVYAKHIYSPHEDGDDSEKRS